MVTACSSGGDAHQSVVAQDSAMEAETQEVGQAGREPAEQHGQENHSSGLPLNGDDGCCSPGKPACSEEGDCCDEADCEDAPTYEAASRSPTLACCDSDEEHCNEKCIIAAAALECEKMCQEETKATNHDGAASHQHAHDENGRHDSSACSTHLSRAFDQYSAYLESARCICRAMLDRGWSTSCCGDKTTESTRPCVDKVIATCSTGIDLDKHSPGHHHHSIKRRAIKTGRGGAAGCCPGDMPIRPVNTAAYGSGHQLDRTSCSFAEKPGGVKTNELDIEKAEGMEHVALSVDGMTCSGCGNKMDRTLKTISGVSAVRVNFVMGRAEFSIDTAVAKPDQVIRQVQRATGFRCTKLTSEDQTVDLLAHGASAKAIVAAPIPGISQATIMSKNVVRLSYDPAVIGARSLVDRLGYLSQGLAPQRDDPSVSKGRKRLYQQLTKTVMAAVLTIPVVVLAWGGSLVAEMTRAYISVVLATLVQCIAVPDFYRPAILALVKSRSVEMDMLVVVSITAAYAYSIVAFGLRVAGHPLETPEFFETSTLLITLVLLGRLVAAFARIRAVEAVSLRSLQSSTAVIVQDGRDNEIDARLLQYGDRLRIGPHTAVPTDALVVAGSSEVDESMLTGESMPVLKKEGDTVIAGTVNSSGTLIARLTRLPGKNTVTDIAQLVEEAANSKPELQDVADRVASFFVPVVTSVAVVVVICWVVVGLKVRNYNTGRSISNAITYAVATLAVACPCALGLAVPMVLVVAGGIAARGGVIIKSAQCTERARKVTDAVFDKTGTITEAEMDVQEELIPFSDAEEAVAITKAMVVGNNHPVSLAVAKHLEQRVAPLQVSLENVHVIPGAGVEATLNGARIRAGNPKWTGTETSQPVSRFLENGMTILVITRDSTPIAIYGLRIRIRAEASRVISQLSRRGIVVHLVSGDQKRAVESVATQVGISNVASGCTPPEKRDYVAALMSQGKNVMFVGDGTNDAVAVAQADVGVQLASVLSASDVTRGAADVVLLGGLEGIPFLLDVSVVSFRRMVFNFVWSAVYNFFAILLASGAFVNVRIPPAYAGLGEIVSVLPVIIAATTMLMVKIQIRE